MCRKVPATSMNITLEVSVNKDEKLFGELLKRLDVAEQKHPVFAEGIYQGFGRIGEEYGEACQAVNHVQGEERVMDEALDLLCVAWRFCRGDWRTGDEKGYDYTAYDGKNVRMVKD